MTHLNIKLLGDGKLSVQIKEINGEEHVAFFAQDFYTSTIINNKLNTTLFNGIDAFYVKQDGIYIQEGVDDTFILIGEKI
ncbi:hypothetical protein ACI8B_210113 [Acinetobacter proteolyticus]|uniref:Uncharacterized protein n=1 Tax=Acinetobacter proteolyticus TaxID=1776741 RepID=A0A653K4Q6_9GAMM|nr:hypothetical protein [Acinetobacter proteolyticus]VXA55317.1 hypothetical protein ACI8B_210113 [Acinetobacter proteolyticus]